MVAETQNLLELASRRFLSLSRIGWQYVAVLAFLSSSVFAQASGQSFTIGDAGPPRVEIPYNLRKDLETNGIRLSRTVNGVDYPLAELWPVRNVTALSGKTPTGVAYRRLSSGRALAVLYLPKAILDIRLQTVPQGFYLLRYARLDLDPIAHETDDGEKASDTQYHDYVSLARMESGTKSSAELVFGRAAKLSTQELTGHKAALLALPPLNPAYKMFPYAVSDDVGHCAVQFKLSVRLASGQTDEMGIALLLVNPPNLSEED